MKIPIKQSLFAISTALVMGSSVQSVYAAEPTPIQHIYSNDQIGYDWTVVQEIGGISISFASVQIGEERFLSVKFDNKNSVATDFIWSMTKNGESVVITADEMIESIVRLDSNGSTIHDGIYLIELSEGDQFSNFVVTIQPTKR